MPPSLSAASDTSLTALAVNKNNFGGKRNEETHRFAAGLRHGVDDGRHEVAHIGESVTAEESVCFLNDGAMADKDNAAADTTFNDAYIIASNMDAGNLVVLSQLFAPPFCSHSRKKEILVSRIFCNYHMFSKFHS